MFKKIEELEKRLRRLENKVDANDLEGTRGAAFLLRCRDGQWRRIPVSDIIEELLEREGLDVSDKDYHLVGKE